MPPSKPTKRDESTPPVKPTGAAALPNSATGGEVEVPRLPQIQLLRGMKDLLPSEQAYWDRVRTLAASIARTYGYARIDTPILEDIDLFMRAVGKGTDIIEKEMFAFTDQGGDRVALRPEATAAIVRAYIEHGFVNQPQPVKLWYLGPMFRYDRPQAGRLRQFHQFGLEVLGEKHPAIDAELMLLGSNFFRDLGIPVHVQVNSIGCALCRAPYEVELTTYFRTHRTDLCETCRKRLTRGATLRMFDCKEPGCRTVCQGAPQIVDWLCEECKQHFIKVLEYLDELEVPYGLAPFLVRGLEYYTRTVFEFLPAEAVDLPDGATAPAQSAIAGGGRYDMLVEQLGGRPTPAVGVAFGIERVLLKLKEAIAAGRATAPVAPVAQVYLAQLGEQAKRRAMRLFERFRGEGIAVAANFAKDALKAQLEQANRLGVRLTLILGQKEVIDETIIIREMNSGIQEIIAYDKVLAEVQKRLTQEAVRASVTDVIAPTDETPAEAAPLPKDLPPVSTLEDFEESSSARGDESESEPA